MQGGDIPSFDAVLQALSGPLVAIAVGLILSVLVEYWPQYETLAAKWKRVVFFGLCLVVPITAAACRALFGYVPWSFDPLIWTAIWSGLGAAGVGTLAHTRKLAIPQAPSRALRDITLLIGLVFADRGFRRMPVDAAIQYGRKLYGLDDLSADQLATFRAAFVSPAVRAAVDELWVMYDRERQDGNIPISSPWYD